MSDNPRNDANPINDGYEGSAFPIIAGGAPVATPAPEPHKNPNDAPEKKKSFREQLQDPVALCTVVIAITAVIQCGITYRQLDAMNRQLKEMAETSKQTEQVIAQMETQTPGIVKAGEAAQISADVAVQSLKESVTASRIDRRPYLIFPATDLVSPPSSYGIPVEVNIKVVNIGKTPAMSYHMEGRLIMVASSKERAVIYGPLEKHFKELRANVSRVSKLIGRSDVAPGTSVFQTERLRKVFTQPELALFAARKLAVFVIAVVTYTDAFGVRYESELCRYYTGEVDDPVHVCSGFNTIR